MRGVDPRGHDQGRQVRLHQPRHHARAFPDRQGDLQRRSHPRPLRAGYDDGAGRGRAGEAGPPRGQDRGAVGVGGQVPRHPA